MPDQIAEGPDLSSVGVAAKHQSDTGTGGSVGMPRFMREVDGGPRRPFGEQLRNEIAVLSGTAADGAVVDADQNETRMDFGPGVAQHLDARLRQCGGAPIAAVVVAPDGPDAVWGGETAQDRHEFLLRSAVPFEDIPEQDHQVGLLRLDLGDARRQPLCPEQRAEVQVGYGNEHLPIPPVG